MTGTTGTGSSISGDRISGKFSSISLKLKMLVGRAVFSLYFDGMIILGFVPSLT
jgi:hypothetical protein